jgi:lysophospholipase L1-like esterase
MGRALIHQGRADFDWTQVTAALDFDGTACAIYLDPMNNNFSVMVDGELAALLGPRPADTSHPLYRLWLLRQGSETPVWTLQGLKPGRHRLELVKRSGANFGMAKLWGFRLDSEARLRRPAPPSKRRLEFIGDSLTNGYGVDGPGKECKELRCWEDGAKAWAALAARELGADFQVIAISGYGVVRNYGEAGRSSRMPLPAHYHRTVSLMDGHEWDRARFKPDAIVINLGTNDHSTQPMPTEDEFVAGYLDLIEDARAGRKGTPVVIGLPLGNATQEKRTRVVAERAAAKGWKVSLIELDKPEDSELGCDWHPKAAVQRRWAERLKSELATRLGW